MLKARIPAAWICMILFILGGCASGNKKSHLKLRKLAREAKIDEAISFVKSKKFFPEERSRLLKLLELGTLYQLSGKYYQALLTFNKAHLLSDKLFTKSISKKALALVTNNNKNNYYGEKYERSLIRFYQTLIHYELYQSGRYESYFTDKKKKVEGKILTKNQRRTHLSAARATILEWDSLLENYKSVLAGRNTYKVDLMAKIWGAFIHEQIGTRSDLNIAKNLYKDAKKVLFRNYNLYDSFNSRSKLFSENFSKLPKMSLKKVKKKYISKTKFSKNLLNYINLRVKDIKKGNKDNLKIVIQDGYITPKTAKKIDFPIPVNHFRTVRSGHGDIFSFTMDLLNTASGTLPSFSFELPEIKNHINQKYISIIIKNKAGLVIKHKPAALVNPLSDIAAQTLGAKNSSIYTKIGARLAAKHIAAIGASYVIYKQVGMGLQGKLAAGISYAAANKAIKMSEKADLRFWSTLPSNIRVSSLRLKPGTYDLFYEIKEGQNISQIKYKEFHLKKGETKSLNINLF